MWRQIACTDAAYVRSKETKKININKRTCLKKGGHLVDIYKCGPKNHEISLKVFSASSHVTTHICLLKFF